eukprot:1837601-Pleurochrysis_carterae.AAC.2
MHWRRRKVHGYEDLFKQATSRLCARQSYKPRRAGHYSKDNLAVGLFILSTVSTHIAVGQSLALAGRGRTLQRQANASPRTL